ncbi:MAG: DNA adenine methylase [Hyphomicrobiaceae bacterium]|nr:MAG: DNA adenine methylase [Hyphomicrobiaceae bacterium]
MTALKIHGGKYYLASKIVELMPAHKRYLEAFAGGLSVLLAKPHEGIAEYANDLNGHIANFWAVMRSTEKFERFVHWCNSQPLEQRAFEAARDYHTIFTHDDGDPWAAFQFFVRNRMSRQGLGKDYCTPTSRLRRGMNENVSAWLSAVDGLPEIHERLRRVEIWNRPAVECLVDLDSAGMFAYVDPPYLHSTRSTTKEYGKYEMIEEEHEQLLEVLSELKGKFMLSGYPSKLYNDFAAKFGWRTVEFDVPNNASGSKSKQRKKEVVWMNY